MKKKIVVFLILIMVFIPLTGCNDKKSNDSKEINNTKEINKDISTDESNNKDKDNDMNTNSNAEKSNILEENDNTNTNIAPKQDEKKDNNKNNNNTNNSNNNSNTNNTIPENTPTNTPNSSNDNSNNNQNTQPTQPIKYNIYFNSNGGTQVSSQTIEDGKTVSIPANPTRDNYNFDRWFVNGTQYNFNSPVHSNFTITARWSQKVYTYSKNDSDNMFNMITNYANDKGMVKANYSNSEVLIMMVTMCTENSTCNDHDNLNAKYNKAVSDINKALATTHEGKTVKYHINTQELKNNDLSGTINMYILRMYAYTE